MRIRTLVYLLFGLLWLIAAAVTLEVVTRFSMRAQENTAPARMLARSGEFGQLDFKAQERLAGTAAPPQSPAPAGWTCFGPLDEAGRKAYAADTRTLVLLCDQECRIEAMYLPDTPLEIVQYAQGVQESGTLWSGLSPYVASDLQSAFHSVAAGGIERTFRHYPVPLAKGEEFTCRFDFFPRAGEGGAMITVQSSFWDVLWKSFKPNTCDPFPVPMCTNNLGFLDDDITLPKPPGVLRIACIGASTTAEGPSRALTYPNLLERKLREAFSTERIEVINCGIFALDSAGEVERMPDFIRLEPDLIVHYNFVNDLTKLAPEWIRAEAGLLGSAKRALRNSSFIYRYLGKWLLPGEEYFDQRIEEYTMRHLREVCEQARAAGIDLAVCSFAYPRTETLDSRDRALFENIINTMTWGYAMPMSGYEALVALYNRKVQRLCQEKGLLYLPVSEQLTSGFDTFTDVCHMRLNAIEKKAAIIAEALKDYVRAHLAPAGQ